MANKINGLNGFPEVGAILGGTVARFCRNFAVVELNCGEEAVLLFGDMKTDLQVDEDVKVKVLTAELKPHGGRNVRVAQA